MSDTGSSAGQGQGYYQNGVWLSKAGGARSEKYQKWTDELTKSKVENLDKQKHSSLVKLHSERLQVRTELRGLQQDRRHLSRDRLGSLEDPTSPQRPPSDSSTSRRRHQRRSFPGSLTSVSSTGHSSLGSSSSSSSSSSSTAFGRAGSGRQAGGTQGKAEVGKGVGAKALSPEVSAMKLRNFHSSRALSKLKNNMDLNN